MQYKLLYKKHNKREKNLFLIITVFILLFGCSRSINYYDELNQLEGVRRLLFQPVLLRISLC